MPDLAVKCVNPNISQNGAVNNAQNTNSSVPYYRGSLDYPSDTVQFKGQEVKEKKGLSKGAKWGIGTAIVLAAGVCVYFLTRGKVGAKQFQQFAEHVDFKEAKTMEEAKKFAKDNFGIELDLEDNLFAANMVNDICCDLNNKFKGKAKLNRKWIFADTLDDNYAAFYRLKDNVIGINRDKCFNIKIKKEDGKSINVRIFDKFKNESYLEVKNRSGLISKILTKARQQLFHELGHCNHFEYCDDYVFMNIDPAERKLRGKSKKIFENFKNDIENGNVKEILAKFFDTKYYKKNPAEFVAEAFGWKMVGKELPKEVEEIYLKYGGVPFPS